MQVTLDISTEELEEIARLLTRLRADAAVMARPPELTDDEKRFVVLGRKIDAIKDVRARLKCSLVMAKNIVEAWPVPQAEDRA